MLIQKTLYHLHKKNLYIKLLRWTFLAIKKSLAITTIKELTQALSGPKWRWRCCWHRRGHSQGARSRHAPFSLNVCSQRSLRCELCRREHETMRQLGRKAHLTSAFYKATYLHQSAHASASTCVPKQVIDNLHMRILSVPPKQYLIQQIYWK